MFRPFLLLLTLALAAAAFATVQAAPEAPASKDAKSATGKQTEPEAYTLEAWDFQDPAKFKSMLKDREELMLKMHNLRIKLINEDPELLKMHKQIMELHKELAMQLEGKKDMKKLTDKLREIDADLEKLPRKDSK